MHNHSEKIEPKKLLITIILAILLFGYAYVTRGERNKNSENENTQQISESNTVLTK
jgi:hypothetical protein